MQARIRIALAAFSLAALLPAGPVQAQQRARIKLDLDRTVGQVDSLIYGNFVEHLGRHIYGGIWEPGSPLADQDGFRTDVLAAVKDLNVAIARYPGGNFVSNYHWLDGVGPERIPRLDLAWYVLEPNTFGTNEFMKFVKKVGTRPYFTVNMGTGTIEEARRWVEYTNVKEGPYYAELRKKHGFPEPYGIKYWSLGNEMDGPWQMGHLSVEDYVEKARETAKLMVRTDSTIKLIAAGASNFRPGGDPMHWNKVVLDSLKNYVDYIALHMYVGNVSDNYYDFLATPLVMEQRTDLVRGVIKEMMTEAARGTKPPIYIAWDEYNVWYRARRGADAVGRNALEEKYNLEDALVVAGFLNGFIRNADIVKMANMAQLVNVIAPIFTNPTGMFKQTIYYPLQLFAKHAYGTALDVFVESGKYDTSENFPLGLGEQTATIRGVPYLDVSATHQPDGTVVIGVINRHKDNAIAADILAQEGNFSGPFQVWEVNGPDIKARNDFGSEPVKTVEKGALNASGKSFTYTFPAHSFTMIKGKLRR
ncbi:MAG: alpha-N-arabinofuranosidase [Gemmatimonadetes bacterium]|nr:alpha-N-arabinofuranosidase [Gemmatimonadota bacterium]